MNIYWGIFSKYKTELYGFAILWIMLFHGIILKNTILPSKLRFLTKFLEHGNCGVEIFLFLSGICLFFSMKKDSDSLAFIRKRLVRVFFPLLIIDGCYWAYTCIIQKHSISIFLQKVTLIDFWISGNQQVWFIAIIVPLYLIYPFIYHKILCAFERKKKWLIITMLCVFVYGIAFYLYCNHFNYYKMIEIAFTRIPVFLLGCCCGNLVYENKPISKFVIVISFIGLLMGFAFFYTGKLPLVRLARTPYLVIGPCLALWICILIDKINCTSINQIMALFGEVSLELYIIHILLRTIANTVQLYGINNVLNYYKYIFFVVLSSYTLSKIVNVLYHRFQKAIYCKMF